MADDIDEKQQRQHFRIEYPKSERPTLMVDGVKIEIVDISEKGIKFMPNKDFPAKVGSIYSGVLKFVDGSSFKIVGKVLRVNANVPYCAMELSQGVPLTKMMEEHRKLLQKFKK